MFWCASTRLDLVLLSFFLTFSKAKKDCLGPELGSMSNKRSRLMMLIICLMFLTFLSGRSWNFEELLLFWHKTYFFVDVILQNGSFLRSMRDIIKRMKGNFWNKNIMGINNFCSYIEGTHRGSPTGWHSRVCCGGDSVDNWPLGEHKTEEKRSI